MPIDYTKFDRLVAEDETEDRMLEEQRRQLEEDKAQKEVEERKRKEFEALRKAEEDWRMQMGNLTADISAGTPVVDSGKSVMHPHQKGPEVSQSQELPQTSQGPNSTEKSKAAGKSFDNMTQQEIDDVDVDDFFRPISAEEREQRKRLKQEKEERRLQREEAAGKRPLRDKGMTPEEVQTRLQHLGADRREMGVLMERCDRPAVKARLGEFLLEMDNEMARLREDPLELDDEDRRELRLFHLRKMQLPGTARTQKEFDETMYAPRAIIADETSAPVNVAKEELWDEIKSFALSLGDADTPYVTVDVRLEAVERLPGDAVSCHFTSDSFDLQIIHSLQGRRYRLVKTCLQHDILPDRSSFNIKRNHVIVMLAKDPGLLDEGEKAKATEKYSLWTDLSAVDRKSRNPCLSSNINSSIGS